MPDNACDGQNVALKWQFEVPCVIRWRAWSSKKNLPTSNSSMPNDFHDRSVLSPSLCLCPLCRVQTQLCGCVFLSEQSKRGPQEGSFKVSKYLCTYTYIRTYIHTCMYVRIIVAWAACIFTACCIEVTIWSDKSLFTHWWRPLDWGRNVCVLDLYLSPKTIGLELFPERLYIFTAYYSVPVNV